MPTNDNEGDNAEEEDGEETPEETDDVETLKAQNKKLVESAIRARERAKVLKAQLNKQSETKPVQENKSGEFDYGQKAYLKASGINADEFELVHEVMAQTGKKLDDVLDSKYFQAELKERRDAKTTQAAIPSASKRSSTTTRDSVDYWIAKGEMPPADQPELRRAYVKAKRTREENQSKFTSNPLGNSTR